MALFPIPEAQESYEHLNNSLVGSSLCQSRSAVGSLQASQEYFSADDLSDTGVEGQSSRKCHQRSGDWGHPWMRSVTDLLSWLGDVILSEGWCAGSAWSGHFTEVTPCSSHVRACGTVSTFAICHLPGTTLIWGSLFSGFCAQPKIWQLPGACSQKKNLAFVLVWPCPCRAWQELVWGKMRVWSSNSVHWDPY